MFLTPRFRSLALATAAAAVLLAHPGSADDRDDRDDRDDGTDGRRGSIVVANRAGGTISVIDPRSDEVSDPIALPAGPNQPEPMYIVDGGRRRALVGDRANRRVVVFDSRSFDVLGTIPAGAGVFHMWAGGGLLWVNNDVDRTATVIDLSTLAVIATVPMPADLVALGGFPHDVVLDPHHGRYAYVSMLGLPGANDYVVRFSTRTFTEVGRAAVGKDPHLSFDHRYEQLFVPAQNSNAVYVLDAASLEQLAVLPVPGAHGAGMTRSARRLYTTNLPGGGSNALFTIDTRTRSLVGDPVNAPFPVPHNIALTPDGRKLYVTHSGAAANQVSIYRTGGKDGLALEDTATVGLNPFGIAFVR